jgi:cell division septation protein DedD
MTVTCPQCQSENQVEAPATSSRVVCSRCATLIPVMTPNLRAESPLLELDVPRPPTASGGGYSDASPLDFDSLFAPPVSAAAPPRAPQNWEFDEVLDIPKAAPPAASGDPSLQVEELLAASPRAGFTTQETGAMPTAEYSRDALVPLPEANGHQAAEAKPAAAWAPSAAPGTSRPTVAFPQDSFQFTESTIVMTPPRKARGGLAKVLAVLALLVAFAGASYYFLGDLLRDYMRERGGQQTAKADPPAATAPTTAPANASKPAVVPTSAAKPADSTPQPAGSQTPKLASSSVPAAATPAPAKPTPQPTAETAGKPQSQPVGHSVGQSDGSLTVQVGAYNDAGQASERAAKLKAAGVEARVVKAQIPGKGTWYRVQAGRFTNQTEAGRYRQEIIAKGVAKEAIVTGYQAQ